MRIPFGRRAVVGAIALACVAPAAAAADNGNGNGNGHANGHGNTHTQPGKTKVHNVTYVFKGIWNAGAGTVTVKHGNAHVRKAGLVGTDVTFDLSSARFVVRDTNKDGQRNADDLADGDHVLVKARLPRKDPGTQPFKARMVIDNSARPHHSK